MSGAAKFPDAIAVQHNTVESRFEMTVGGILSVLDYELCGEVVTVTHTWVPPELRGRGIAEKLVRSALAWVVAENRRVVPACSYVNEFIRRHPEFQPLVAAS